MATTSASGIFNGTSRFSTDFQSVISRAVSIASLPLNQLQSQQQTLQAQSTALGSLQSQFTSLSTAVAAIDSAISNPRLTATSSSYTVANASVGATALPGDYQVQVLTLGSSSSTISKAGLTTVTDPNSQNIITGSTFSFTINGKTTAIAPLTGTLSGLAQAINSTPGLGASATIINLGSNSQPDYRLAIHGESLASDTISLQQNGTDLLDQIATGAPATLKVNGSSQIISSDSAQYTAAPGITVSLLGTGSATIHVAKDQSAVASALAGFATAYNASKAELAKSRGPQAGALSGQSVVNTISTTLDNLSAFGSAGSINSLASVGLQFDQQGNLSFDASAFSAAQTADPAGVLGFLGGATTGGFLQAATLSLSGLLGTNGVLPTDAASLTSSIASDGTLISQDQDRVNQLQTSLTDKINAADASIASLEQQVIYVNGLFNFNNNNSSN